MDMSQMRRLAFSSRRSSTRAQRLPRPLRATPKSASFAVPVSESEAAFQDAIVSAVEGVSALVRRPRGYVESIAGVTRRSAALTLLLSLTMTDYFLR